MALNRIHSVLIAVCLVGTACGNDTVRITFDPTTVPATTAAVTEDGAGPSIDGPVSSLPDVEVGDRWVDATSNLEGLESWCGNLAFVSARPDRDEMLAGVAGQGLFSDDPDSGQWVPFGRRPGSAPLDHRTSSIIYDPANPRQFWESGFFGLGPPPNGTASSVNRTDDDGATFTRLGDAPPADLVSVDFDDVNRQTLLVGIRGTPTVFRSADGGATWADISSGLPSDIGEASFPHVLDASTYLVGSHPGDRGAAAAPGVFRTTDAGGTWTQVFDQGVSGPPLVSSDGNLYWLLDRGGVIASDDSGVSWTLLAGRGPAGGGRRNRIVEVPDGTWVSMGVDYMVVSRDQGASWRTVGPPLPYEPSGFTYSFVREAVYAWRNYCDFEAGPNPILAQSIVRLDLDLDL
jgi:hypothetical protein